MTVYGYGRVSTDGQTLDAQIDAPKAAGAEKVYSGHHHIADSWRKRVERWLRKR
jgi:DNA invertase Pin-like site-specific DNA recombinase